MGKMQFNSIRIILIGLCFIAFSIYMNELNPIVPYMDSLRYLLYVKNSIEGEAPIYSTWNQGEHRGLLVQLGTYINARLFDFDIEAATFSCGVVLSMTSWLLLNKQTQSFEKNGSKSIFGLLFCFAITVTALFSFSNWELYSLDVGVFLFAKVFTFICYWLLLHRCLQDQCKLVDKISAVMLIPFIVLTIAYGWSYAFTMTIIISCVFFQSWEFKSCKFRLLIISSCVISIFLYVFGDHFFPTRTLDRQWEPLNFINIFLSFFYAISSIFMGQESWQNWGFDQWLRIILVITFIGHLLYLAKINFHSRKVLYIPYILIVYSLLNIAAVAYSRGNTDPQAAAAGRYYLDFSLIIIGSAWLFTQINHSKKFIKIIGYGLFSSFIIGQFLTSLDEFRKAPYRHDGFLKIEEATLLGSSPGINISTLTQSPAQIALDGMDVQRKYGIGAFRKIKCDERYLYGHFDDGWIEKKTRMVLRNCGKELTINIFAPANSSENAVSVYTPDGNLLSSEKMVPGIMNSVKIRTHNMGLILEFIVEVEKTSIPAELEPNSSDTRKLGAIIADVKFH